MEGICCLQSAIYMTMPTDQKQWTALILFCWWIPELHVENKAACMCLPVTVLEQYLNGMSLFNYDKTTRSDCGEGRMIDGWNGSRKSWMCFSSAMQRIYRLLSSLPLPTSVAAPFLSIDCPGRLYNLILKSHTPPTGSSCYLLPKNRVHSCSCCIVCAPACFIWFNACAYVWRETAQERAEDVQKPHPDAFPPPFSRVRSLPQGLHRLWSRCRTIGFLQVFVTMNWKWHTVSS